MAGLALKTRVFAAVKATNLDKRYDWNTALIISCSKRRYCCAKWSNYDFPAKHFADFALFFFALLTLITSLCYYFSRAPVSSGISLDLSFSHVQIDPILHPISQFCPCAGGTSWWTTVTQPPPGILMMNSAMTFSFGNLAFCSFFEMLTR